MQTATLFYRTTGTPSYTFTPMTPSGPTFRGTIPGSAVTEAGLQYYLEARNADGKAAHAPSTAPGTPYSVVVGTTVFTDDPLTPRVTPIKAKHLTELRDAINTLRSRVGLGPFAFPTDAIVTPRATSVKAAHLSEMCTALKQAYPAAACTTAIAPGQVIQAIHFTNLRKAVREAE